MSRSTRVLLDTNVLLNGAIWRGSHAEALVNYRGPLSFLTPSYCVSEAEAKISSMVAPEVAGMLATLLDTYLLRLGCVVASLQDLPPDVQHAVSRSDRPIYQTAEGIGVDYICTYNIRDFPDAGPAARSPLGILSAVADPQKYMVQVPVLWKEGTMIVGTRQYGDDRVGLLLETPGLRVAQAMDRSIVAEGPDLRGFHATGHVVPDGYAHALVLRYKADGDFDITAWPLDSFPDECPVGSSGDLLLGRGQAVFAFPVAPGLSLGRATDFQGELFFASGIPQYVRDRSLKKQAVRDQTLEGVRESQSLEALLSMCRVRANERGDLILEVEGAFSRRAPATTGGSA